MAELSYTQLPRYAQYNVLRDMLPDKGKEFRSDEDINQILRDTLIDRYGIIPLSLKYDLDYLDTTYYPILFTTDNLLTKQVMKALQKKYSRRQDYVAKAALEILDGRAIQVKLNEVELNGGDIHYYPALRFDIEPRYFTDIEYLIAHNLNISDWHAGRILSSIIFDLRAKYNSICESIYEIARIVIQQKVNKVLIEAKNYTFDEYGNKELKPNIE